ncbi:MAG: DRTGG domain-containing protein [Planctomycetota bacterium]|jgi:predicted transcriptional regulator
MKLGQVKEILGADLLVGQESLDLDIKMGCGADLLSDVLAFTKPDSLLLTGLTHPQVIQTTEIADIMAVCFVRGKRPPAETVEMAKEKGVPLLCTCLPMYESCSRLYSHGLPGCSQATEEE